VTVTRTELANHTGAAFRGGPASREGLLAYAITSHARPEVIGLLQGLPAERYDTISDLWRHLSETPAEQ
jgi:uncharacterized protein DUF2795